MIFTPITCSGGSIKTHVGFVDFQNPSPPVRATGSSSGLMQELSSVDGILRRCRIFFNFFNAVIIAMLGEFGRSFLKRLRS